MELRFSSSMVWQSPLADDVDCFVSLRVGECQRMAKLGSTRAFHLPPSVANGDHKITGRLDVLKCISSCSIAIDANGFAPLEHHLPCPCEPAIGSVCVNMSGAAIGQATDASRTIEESSYLNEHGIQEVLADAVRAALKERPEDPRSFIAKFLMVGAAGTPRMNPPPRSPRVNAPGANQAGMELQQLRQQVSQQGESISQLVRDMPLTFTVLQYNILARYLGNNMEPWFCYGVDISEERRKELLARHGEKDENGKYKYVGWPSYAKDVLTDEEIQKVEDHHARVFDWKVRRQRLVDNVLHSNCDIVAMEEMDEYQDFAEAMSNEYDGVFQKRPRKSSKDGCAVFWRKNKFELAATSGFDFVDKQDKGADLKDRTCVLVLLRWATARYGRHESRVLIVCTHLARNPEDPSQTKVRARQAAQLMKHMTEFTTQNNAAEVPVVLMGDLNAQHFGEVRGIARTVFQVSGHPCHNFLFRCADVPTGPTSVTDVRRVRIDAVMYMPKHLKVLGIQVPHLRLGNPIPDEVHPSDHVPVRVKFEVKADHLKMQECARTWLECVTGESRLLPMTVKELKRAFSFLDRDSSGDISKRNLQENIMELDMGRALPPDKQKALLDCFPGQAISEEEFVDAYEIKFNSTRMGNIGDLEQAFSFFDADNDGKVTQEDVKTAFSEIVPIDFTDEEVVKMIENMDGFDKDALKDGLDIHEFCEALCKVNFSCNEQILRRRSVDVEKFEELRRNLAGSDEELRRNFSDLKTNGV